MPKNELCKKEKVQTITSIEVAEMLGKEHWMVLRDIEGTDRVVGIIPTLADNNFVVSEYFMENTYKDGSGKRNKCYDCTKMGCEMLGNKQQGEKGILFTAKYVKRFNDMEQAINAQPMCIEDLIIANAKALKETREQAELATLTAQEAKQEIQSMREVMILDPTAWRKETTNIINRIAQKLGGNENIQAIRKESYELLEIKAKAQLGIRLTNMKRKVLEETGSKSKADKVTKLDVIDSDGRLKEIYISIVKEMAIKYAVA